MAVTFASLLVIFLVALAAPILASSIPHKPIPEVVFLLVLGALLGPNMAGLVQVTDEVSVVSELGLAFLFLIAGYEINPKDLAGNMGRTAAGTWFVCFAVAFVLVAQLPDYASGGSLHDLALTIAMTTTAYGTLAPILKDRGVTNTPVGKAVTAHGVMGELLPIVAIAVLLSTRASWQAVLILVGFFVFAFLLATASARARKAGTRFYRAIENMRDTSSQTLVRLVVAIMLVLVALCAVFDLDVVLGGFTAGFVLRFIMPEGDHGLEKKLEVLGFGFFIPVFFVVSGAGIDLLAVFDNPGMLLVFMLVLLCSRTVPVFLSTFVSRDTRGFSAMQRLNVALYSTMALPLIVAICNIATTGGFMTETAAGTLMTAGTLTVLITPVLTSLTRTVADAHPVAAIQDLYTHPGQRDEVLSMYRTLRREARERYRTLRDLSDAPDFDEAREAARVLQDFNAQRLALLAELRADELQQVVDVKSADPDEWERITADRRRRWEHVKRRGDEAWARVKELGDRELAEMSEHGDRYLAERLESAREVRDALRGAVHHEGRGGHEGVPAADDDGRAGSGRSDDRTDGSADPAPSGQPDNPADRL